MKAYGPELGFFLFVVVMGWARMVMPVLIVAVVVFMLVLFTLFTLLAFLAAISRPVGWGVSLLLTILLMLVALHTVA